MAGLLPDLFGGSVIVEDGTNEHYTALPEVIRAVEKITGSGNLKTLDSCRKNLESYFRKSHDLCHALEEFKVILDCLSGGDRRLSGGDKEKGIPRSNEVPGDAFSKKMAATYSPTCAVPSARAGLTSLFGMGRGGTPQL